MRDYGILIRRICLIVSVCIYLTPFPISLFLKELRTSLFAWLSFFSLYALITGYVAAWAINIAFVRRLKDYFPEWKKEITQFFFGRFSFLTIPIVSGDALPSFIQKDQEAQNIQAIRDLVRKFSICWIYIPTALLVLLIIGFAFYVKS